MLANEGVRRSRWWSRTITSIAKIDREPEVRLRRESLGRTSSAATMVARTSIAMIIPKKAVRSRWWSHKRVSSIVTMIANNWINRDEAREPASSTVAMFARTNDPTCDGNRERAKCLTAMKFAWMQQSMSLIDGIDRNDVRESERPQQSMAMRISGEKTKK